MRIDEFKSIVTQVCGMIQEWEEYPSSIRFRTAMDITLPMIVRLSEALGTDRINFNCGRSGEPAYSEVTPGTDASPGYIEVMWPIPTRPQPPAEPRKGPPKLTLDLDDG